MIPKPSIGTTMESLVEISVSDNPDIKVQMDYKYPAVLHLQSNLIRITLHGSSDKSLLNQLLLLILLYIASTLTLEQLLYIFVLDTIPLYKY